MIIDKTYVPKKPYVPLEDPNSREAQEAYRNESIRRRAKKKAAKLRRNNGPIFQGTYQEYLVSKTWAKKRALRLAKDQYKCVVCQTAANQVHHWYYTYPYGRERDYQLASMCCLCHIAVHRDYEPTLCRLRGSEGNKRKIAIHDLINRMRRERQGA